MSPLLHLMTNIEPLLNLVAFLVVLRAHSWKRYPAVTVYLGFRCLIDLGLTFVLYENRIFSVSPHTQTITYIYGYWGCYIIGALAIFFALQEVFKAVMEPVPGLERLGIIAFRWVSVASAIILLAMTSMPAHRDPKIIYASIVGLQIMRCISVLEICLIAFLAISVHSLGRSFRGRVFGIGLGFGIQAAAELISSAFLMRSHSIWSIGNLFIEVASLSALLIWTGYFLVPETAAEAGPITLPVTSPLLRWNEIALALGQRPPQVALGAASSAFFLQDVEQVVDKFLTKTP
ncbi:MAG TPA: hypothetical protein VFW25_14015 [Silvibacterium sp.]|nr:hypothetical protein [Silvibacterium sp.]